MDVKNTLKLYINVCDPNLEFQESINDEALPNNSLEIPPFQLDFFLIKVTITSVA